MVRRPTAKQKMRTAKVQSFPAPTAGWVSNRNLATPGTAGAMILQNMFPTQSSVVMRRGTVTHCEVDEGAEIKALFSYVTGAATELFAATDNGIWDVTTSTAVDTTYTSTNGDWSVVQITTSGGTYLVGVNGTDAGFLYDGSTFAALSITGVDTADLSHVWIYQSRLYFIEKNSMSAWYLDVNSIAGAATELPLGAVFTRGGVLLFGETWSLDSGGSGGLSDQCVFVTTEGEVAAYQGLSPEDSATWGKVGLYRTGRPMGKKAYIRAGGDLVIATTMGFLSLAKSADADYAALGQLALSYAIEDDWAAAVFEAGEQNWRAILWPDQRMVVIAPPATINSGNRQLVVNANTGAWCEFTGWDVTALETMNGRLLFGSSDGIVREAMVGGSDEGEAYTGVCLPLYSDLGAPANLKIARMARVTTRSVFKPVVKVSGMTNFSTDIPNAPNGVSISGVSLWEVGLWDESTWGEGTDLVFTGTWKSVGGAGSDLSVCAQTTSGDAVPLDTEFVRIDLTFETADIVT